MSIWIGILVDIKIIAFEKAWYKIWKIKSLKFKNLTVKSINLSWLVVLKATTFFKSNQPKARRPEKKEVKILNNLKIDKNFVEYNLLNFTDKNTLATTIVEECKSDETGVGPSMAIGSQKLKPKSEDFLKIDKKIKNKNQKSKTKEL